MKGFLLDTNVWTSFLKNDPAVVHAVRNAGLKIENWQSSQ